MKNTNSASLAKPLRTQLENTVKAARDVAEKAALAALHQLGVGDAKLPEHLDDAKKSLRRRLRAHGRSLGDAKHKDDSQELTHLMWEVAYEHWHRMLFARFLAENHLLLWEPGAPVTLAECEELAQDPSTNLGAKSGWELAGKLAARMLPQVFKPHSPAFELRFSPNEQRDLENLLKALPTETLQASDSLGWVYQFWQAKRKAEVNASEVKIGADELPAVTQLFTEQYMVAFLLENALGGWWLSRHPRMALPVAMPYFRKLDNDAPAAGTFPDWPDTLTQFKLLDPCAGSGHFLVSALHYLVPMRRVTENLSVRDAIDRVLADNLHGLELDARCVEIAAFALALAAWRYPDEKGEAIGYRPLPRLNIACVGVAPRSKKADWLKLAGGDERLEGGMAALYALFQKAPELGSLIDPMAATRGDLLDAHWDELESRLDQALAQKGDDQDIEARVAAQGMVHASRILTRKYHLVVTNPPYLGGRQHGEVLRDFCEQHYKAAKGDLANVFLDRSLKLCAPGGAVSFVMPQNWLFLKTYQKQREHLLRYSTWNLLARLGSGAFETITGEIVNAILLTLTHAKPIEDQMLCGLDAIEGTTPENKSRLLVGTNVICVNQQSQLKNPDSRIVIGESTNCELLQMIASSSAGMLTGDGNHFCGFFWEPRNVSPDWEFMQGTVSAAVTFGGRSQVVLWENGTGQLAKYAESVKHLNTAVQRWRSGQQVWGKKGVVVSSMGSLECTLYLGDRFDNNVGVITPHDPSHLAAIWTYCSSPQFPTEVRKIDQKVNVTAATFAKVPFDLAHWQKVAAERYPNGLPKPYSDDPTQWIFHGHPKPATDPLQVAVVRLLGYRWPAESDAEMELSDEARTWVSRCQSLASHADDDGIVCLSAVRGEKPAHERLLALLIDAWESVEPGSWKPSVLDQLLADADCAGKGLEVWLREKFFEQHAKRFQHRPFVWHIWDGLKDGFGALVNYHQLDNKNLERLIHTYLGDWIRTQEQGVKDGTDGAQARLSAGRSLKTRLEAILDGEKPYDIFVRWKSLAQQPIGWNPDLNDGVRLNIRPFMTAEVLRHNKKPKLNITWDKDRGKDVDSAPWFKVFQGERINDHHLTLDEKRRARD